METILLQSTAPWKICPTGLIASLETIVNNTLRACVENEWYKLLLKRFLPLNLLQVLKIISNNDQGNDG